MWVFYLKNNELFSCLQGQIKTFNQFSDVSNSKHTQFLLEKLNKVNK